MKIQLFVPYFGKLPNYFSVFLKTACRKDTQIVYTIFTDDPTVGMYKEIIDKESAINIDFVRMSFAELNNLSIGKGIGKIYTPYKLCDFRPTYGTLFAEYLLPDAEYWGYCDIDTLMGDIPSFLANNNYQNYDRFGREGGFTIYRNTPSINTLYSKTYKGQRPYGRFDFVKNTTIACFFDEIGMNKMCRALEVKFLPKQFCAGVAFGLKHLHTWDNEHRQQLLVWRDGHTYCYTKMEDGSLNVEETMYIHFLDHKNMPTNETLDKDILATHLGFFRFNEEKVSEYLETYGAVDSPSERSKKSSISTYLKKRINMIVFEFKSVGFLKGITNFYFSLQEYLHYHFGTQE